MRSFTSIIRDHFTIMALLIDRFLCNLCLLDDKFSIVASFLDSICILTCAFFVPLEGYSENVCGEIVRNVHSYKFIHISIFLFFFLMQFFRSTRFFSCSFSSVTANMYHHGPINNNVAPRYFPNPSHAVTYAKKIFF